MVANRTVAVVDYGMGNLFSMAQAVRRAADGTGFEVIVTARPDQVRAAERIVLPGQGAMPDCMRELLESGLKNRCWRRQRPSRCLVCVLACRCC